ncbi:hypothetical protein [Cellulomonas sp. S1-8]|uniref:hypothetical protein n=1 Tax=Cellulomonas sp. S1-8 TaxID=2904790 RepID=UPI0022439FAF|nr:hypothetical protein [Cellulomonas sp. S1-8]UZN04995.1 hypothetical protein OKX07_08910 [Cellulomonas sp. S1-8]
MSEPVLGTAARGAVPTPTDVPVTGDDAVDEALRRLVDVEGHDLRSQVSTFEDVHGALQDRLADAEG